MSRPLVCDNPECETTVEAEDFDELIPPETTVPRGWVTIEEVDPDGDEVLLGEFCSRACASSYLTLEVEP